MFFLEPHLIVDTCCSKNDKLPPVNKIVELECNKISDKDFRQNFALTAQPVLLEQCSGVNFINIFCVAFTHEEPKSVKRQ